MSEVVLHGHRHCCVCDQPCFHIGPIRLCREHSPRRMLETVPPHKIAEVNPE